MAWLSRVHAWRLLRVLASLSCPVDPGWEVWGAEHEWGWD